MSTVRARRTSLIGVVLLTVAGLVAGPPLAAQEEAGPVSVSIVDALPWKERARLAIDPNGLTAALQAHGYRSGGGNQIILLFSQKALGVQYALIVDQALTVLNQR